MQKDDLTGQRFVSLTVLQDDLQPYVSPAAKTTRRWVCRCNCGNEIGTTYRHLLDDLQSCGRLLRETATRKMADPVNGCDPKMHTMARTKSLIYIR